MRGHREKTRPDILRLFAMCLCGAVGICFASNLLTFFVFYEILTVATYPLVVHYRDEKGKKAGRKYLIYTLGSGQLFLGTVLVYFLCGSLDFVSGGFIGGFMEGGGRNGFAVVIFVLLITGGAVKAGIMPPHSWSPELWWRRRRSALFFMRWQS